MSEENQQDDTDDTALLDMTTTVVAAYLGNNAVPSSQISEVISAVHGALSRLAAPDAVPAPEPQKPAVPIKKSVTPDFIICLEDGKHLKMLKRHLRTTYGMSPDEYRAKWNLPPDYPMVAPNYARQRSEFAKKIGLGKQTKRQGGRRGRS